MGWESLDVVIFDFEPLLQGQTKTVKLKVLISRLLLILKVCNVKPTYRKSWAGNLLMLSGLTLGPLLQGQTRRTKHKSAYNCLLLVLEACNVKPTYRKSWNGNLLMWSDLTLGPSFKIKRWFTGFGELTFQWIQICIGFLMVGLVYAWFMSQHLNFCCVKYALAEVQAINRL